MKPNLGRGNGFRGLLAYLLDEDGAPRPGASVGGGNIDAALDIPWARALGEDYDHRAAIKSLSSEFAGVRRLRPDAKNPVWHCSLSLPAGEHLADEQWAKIVEQMLRHMKMNTATHPFVWVRHADTGHEHIHIVASRIANDGRLWVGEHDAATAQDACRVLEKRHGLTITYAVDKEGKPDREGRRAPTARERRAEKTGGLQNARQIIQDEIDALVAPDISLPDLVERLAERGIDVVLNQSKTTGRISGISFALDDVTYAGRQLGKDYSWPGLQKRGVRSGAGAGNEPAEVWEGASPRPARRSSIEPGDSERKQAYKALLLAEHYRSAVGEDLAALILRVDMTGDPTVILRDRSRVTDRGEKISTTRATAASVQLMFDIAQAKGWSTVKILGADPEFLVLAIEEAARRGIPIENLGDQPLLPTLSPAPVDDRATEADFVSRVGAAGEEIVDQGNDEDDDFAPR